MRSPGSQAAHRFEGLDLLRGIAAGSVVLLHWFDGNGSPWFHYGHLAVDFFFLLSGFVIARSYEARLLGTMGFSRFMTVRLIRLYPMIVMGIVLGLSRAVLRGHFAPEYAAAPSEYELAAFANVLMLPLPFATRLGPSIFPLNAVFWSLFFELAANAFYAAGIRRLSNRVLTTIVLASFAGLAAVVLAGVNHSGGLTAGADIHTWGGGFFRVGFSFFLGVLLYRQWAQGGWLFQFSANTALISAILLLLLSLPAGTLLPIEEVGLVALVFPVFLILAANHNSGPVLAKASLAMGALSYPLYVIQVPVLWIFTGALKFARVPMPFWLAGILAMAAAGSTAFVILKVYDEPVRTLLASAARPRARQPVEDLRTDYHDDRMVA